MCVFLVLVKAQFKGHSSLLLSYMKIIRLKIVKRSIKQCYQIRTKIH